MDTQGLQADIRGFVPATAEGLACLAEGCFVLVRTGQAATWVEIVQVGGEWLRGVAHPELSGALGPIHDPACRMIVDFRREQVAALGCDRYCWC